MHCKNKRNKTTLETNKKKQKHIDQKNKTKKPTVVLLSDRSFPTWQLRHSPPVGNSPQVKNHWSKGSVHINTREAKET